ncbi:MAG TPA: ABC transporter permease, partial [Thermoanaerobaculia bacterium]
NTAVFSVVNAILLQPLPYPNAKRLVDIGTRDTTSGSTYELSYRNFADIREQARSLQNAAAFYRMGAFLERGGELQRVFGITASREILDVLGVKPILGRGFTPEEDREGGAKVMIISHALWRSHYGGDPNIIGRAVRYGSGSATRTVVGVLPEGVRFPEEGRDFEFIIPILQELDERDRTLRTLVFLDGVGLLREGATVTQTQAEVSTIAKRIGQQDPALVDLAFDAKLLQDVLVADVRRPLLVLLGAVGLVLLIGCANVANLLLARAAARQREVSIRTAIGATRGVIVRQMLVESLVLSLLAGALGLLLAMWGIDILVALAPGDIPRLDAARIDLPVLGFTLGLSLLTGIGFGLVPALAAGRTNLVETLKEGARGSTEGRQRNRVRSALIVAEVALSIVLLAGTGLMMRSFIRLSNVDAGYDPTDRTTIDVPARAAYDDDGKIIRHFERIADRFRAIPGVESVSAGSVMPMSGNESVWSFRIIGAPEPPPNLVPNAVVSVVMPDYFKTMGIPLLRGRDFTRQDTPST